MYLLLRIIGKNEFIFTHYCNTARGGGGQRTHRVPERADCHVHHWCFPEWVPRHVVLREALVDVELSNHDLIAVVTYGYAVFTDGCFGCQSPLPASSAAFLFLFLYFRLPLLDNNLMVSGNDRRLLAVAASGLRTICIYV